MRTALPTAPLPWLATIAILFTGIASAPPATAQGIQASGGEPKVILGGEYKSTKEVETKEVQTKEVQTTEEPAKGWSVYTNVGYTSEYNFRGTNLTPDSDGAIYATAALSFSGEWGSLTLGLYGIHQFGTAKADSFSISEGGGGGAAANLTFVETAEADEATLFTGRISPQTIQREFDEIDVYLNYLFHLGPLDITVGNIAFFINRNSETRVTTTGSFTDENITTRGINQTVTIPTVGDEQFDRLFFEVSAPRLIPTFHGISIVPKIRYYQTILSEGDDPLADGRLLTLANIILPFEPDENHPLTVRAAHERNDALGGYLEGRIDAAIPITDRIQVRPFGIISYSFHDRTEPFGTQPNQPRSHIFHGQTLVGFNNAQFGVTIPIELWRGLTVEPFADYSYHISEPTAGTDRNEVWGGAQLVFTF